MTRWLLLALIPCLIAFWYLDPLTDRVSGGVPVPTKYRDDGKALPPADAMADLAKKDPVAFLESCLRRHVREVQGYTMTFHKQERLAGVLGEKEVIDVSFREEPHSVLMLWKEGARAAARALYVEGENEDDNNRCQVVIKPSGFRGRLVKSVLRDPEGDDAKKSGRYPISQFGLKKCMERTLDSWKAAREDKALHVEYLGKQQVEGAGRECFVLKRSRYARPEGNDAVTEQTLYIDTETWHIAGTVLKNETGELVGEYYFNDIRVNPKFGDDVFTRKSIEN